MTKKKARDYTERSIKLRFSIKDYDAAVRDYVRELRCAYLLSYAYDETEAGNRRNGLRAAVSAGILAHIRHAQYDDISGIKHLREDLREEVLENLTALTTAKPIAEYSAMFLSTDGAYSSELRTILTVGRAVEIATLLCKNNKPARTPNELFLTMAAATKVEILSMGSLSPYSRNEGDIRLAWNEVGSAAHIAAAYQTLRGNMLVADVLPLRPFRGIRKMHDQLFDYAEAYQELLCGRKVTTDAGAELICDRLLKGPIWRIPEHSSGQIAALPTSVIEQGAGKVEGVPESGREASQFGN